MSFQEQRAAQLELERERAEWEKELEKKMAAEMSAFEKHLEKETKKDKQHTEKAIETLSRRKENMLKVKAICMLFAYIIIA